MSNFWFWDSVSNTPNDKRIRTERTETTGSIPTIWHTRLSWTGKKVRMQLLKGKMMPSDGRFVKVKMGKLEVNVLCHNTDKDPPKNYKLENNYY